MRRRLFAERLEDRSLMAADLLSKFYNDSTLNLIAEGEAGSTLPNKASYTLEILDANGTPLTTESNRTVTLRNGTEFYLQLVGQDVRPAGVNPINGKQLNRGIFAAYTDILYDKTLATFAENETQSIRNNNFINQTGTFTLTLPANASGKGGTTAPINFNRADNVGTANNIKDALNTTLFGSATANGVKAVYDKDNSRFNVTFSGINNVSLPLMTSSSSDLTISEVLDGTGLGMLAAVEYELDATGFVRYSAGHEAEEAPFGINDIGAFTTAFGFDGTPLPILRIHMIAKLPTTTPASVVFTPDPLGDGSQSLDDLLRPKHNTLVYGNENVTDPAITGSVSDPIATANQFNAASAAALSSMDDAYYGKTLTFTSGPLAGQERRITDYIGSSQTFIFANGFTQTPQNGDTWSIGPQPIEREASLVAFSPTNNEFLNLTGVTLSISNPVYTAVPDTGYSVGVNHTAGEKSVTIPVLANDTITGLPGTPVKEIKSFDATTAGGTITKVGNNLVFTPNVDFSGTATFTYTGGTVGDNSTTATGTITVSVADLPKKASYTLEILDVNGNPLTTGSNRTATLSKGTDFYLQLVGQDIRPAGLDPVKGTELVRGVFAAYTDILYDKTFATIATNETQSILIHSASQTGTFTLTLPANASGKSGTTASINFNRADNTGTAKNIKDALNTALFGSATANGVKVVSQGGGYFNVTFVGINNTSLPLMTSASSDVTIAEVLDGAASNTLAAVEYELNSAGQQRYLNDHAAGEAPFGINDIGGFTFSTGGFGSDARPVLRIHMIATGSTTPQTVVFTPDPISDMLRPMYNTLVYGNNNVTVPGGGIDPNTGEPEVVELEKSLVQFAPTNNEFLNLVGVTLSINNPLYTAVPDTGFSVNENHTAGVNSVTIPVLANDTITGLPGTPVKEIKAFDATTTGGTITKVGNNLVFTPNVDFSGTATFTYTGGPVGDNSTTATGTVTVSVADVNRAPTCNFGPAQNTDDEQGLQTVSGWMTGCTANDPQQTVSFTVSTDKPELFTVVPTVDANGKLSFDPAPNKEGTAKVTVTIKDDGGTASGGADQTQVELQFNVVKLHQFFNAAETGARRGLDVTGSSSSTPDGAIVAQDVLAVINYINANGSGQIPANAPAGAPYVDVNGDGQVVAADVLIIINYINAHPGESEGEAQELSGFADQSLATSVDEMLLVIAADIAGQAKRTRRA